MTARAAVPDSARASRGAPGARMRIVVRGHLPADWADWFAGLSVVPLDDGHSALEGAVADQAALYGLLLALRDLGLTLVSVAPGSDPARGA